MPSPAVTPAEAQNLATYRALLSALSHPGEAQELPVTGGLDRFAAIGHSLLDLETSFFSESDTLTGRLVETGAHPASVDAAAYCFFSQWTEQSLALVEQCKVGIMEYPERAASIFFHVASFESGLTLNLSGPGVDGKTQIICEGLPEAFWDLRNRTRRFPLGWDIFLLTETQVIGIPRSTDVAIA